MFNMNIKDYYKQTQNYDFNFISCEVYDDDFKR